MARDIDFSKPLDSDDKAYLRQRSWLVDEAELQGFDIRKDVESDAPDEEEYDAKQDVIPAPQTTGDAVVPTLPGNEADEEEEEEISYSEASVADLRAELKARELSTEGKKDELIARLEADDAESEEEEEV